MNKKYIGFIAPVITPDNHVLGGVGIPLPVINPSGDWRKYTPTFESQLQTTFDTFGCTVYGTLNAVETLKKFLTGNEENYSDRATYNSVGITPPGSDPQLVATNIRGSGLLNEIDLPSVTASLDEFMTPRPLPVDLRVKAQKWLNEQMLGHQWLWTVQPDAKRRIEILKEALTKGTVSVSVDAWYQNDQGLYYSPNTTNGHWTFITYVEDGVGIHCYDSYNDAKTNTNLKILTLDHNIQFAKVYFFTKPTQSQNWLIQLITSLLSAVGLYEKKIEVVKPVDKAVSPEPQQVYNEVKEELMKKYDWSTQEKARHSVRVICDEEGLSVKDKNDLCGTVGGESGWKPRAIGKPNKDGSRDYGIVQLNDHFWIGEGKLYPNIEAVYNDPEGCIRWMCKQWKAGNKNWWYAYKNGSYKQYLNPSFDKDGNLL